MHCSVGRVKAFASVDGPELHALPRIADRGTLVVVPDEPHPSIDWERLAPTVAFGRIALPVVRPRHRYRLVASIVLAEVSRQVGRPSARKAPGRRRRLTYRSAIELVASGAGELIDVDELAAY